MNRLLPILAALLIALALGAGVASRLRLRADLADLLPRGQTPAMQLLLQQLRDGEATKLVLLGIEGDDAPALARLSTALAKELRKTGNFAFVSNGADLFGAADTEFLFAHRYALAPAAQDFSAAALGQDFARLHAGLASAMAPAILRFGLPDPTGAFPALLQSLAGATATTMQGGVWFDPLHGRALLLAALQTGDSAAIGLIAPDFAALRGNGPARLLMSGPAVFAYDAEQNIRGDVRRLSIVSTLMIAALLLWRFRSPTVLAVIAVPILLSLAAAALAVQAAFGFVHGITLGFGMTMLGVTADYPVLLIGHRKQGEIPAATRARIAAAFRLAVFTAALGMLGMLLSGLPGLTQLGLFSMVGLVVAGAITWFLLPPLIVSADLAPVAAGDSLLWIERWRRLWPAGIALAALALGVLALHPPGFERSLEALSPVAPGARALDAELRAALRAPDVGQLGILHGASLEEVLRREEALGLPDAEFAATLLPSAALQARRQATLPAPAELAAAVTAAQRDSGFSPGAFDAFQSDVATARGAAPLTLADVTSPLLAARLHALLLRSDGIWYGLIIPRTGGDGDALRQRLAGAPGATYLDVAAATNAMIARDTSHAWQWLAAGGGAALLALILGLRQPAMIGRVLAALAASVIITLAVLGLLGQAISLVHIVALQFAIGIGLDYSLFFARRRLDREERARTLRTLITCNAMTLATFGLLATSRTPLLRDIGATVAVGALAAMFTSFLFVGEQPEERS